MKHTTKRQRYRFSETIEHELTPLYALDNWHGVLGLCEDYLLIGIAIFLFHCSAWWYPVTWLLIGSRQRALATLLHESAHLTLAKNRKLNHVLGAFCSGLLIFQDYQTYKVSHVHQHHGFLGNPDEDPDYQYHLQQSMYASVHGKRSVRQVIGCLMKQLLTYAGYVIKHRVVGLSLKSWLCLAAFMITCYMMGCLWEVWILWVVPLLTSFLLIGWLIELAEHYPMVHEAKIDLWMSRNRYSHWLEQCLTGMHREHFHLLHHLKPRLPFWQLKKAHDICMQDPNYRACNATMGGVVWSANPRNPSAFRQWWNHMMGEATVCAGD